MRRGITGAAALILVIAAFMLWRLDAAPATDGTGPPVVDAAPPGGKDRVAAEPQRSLAPDDSKQARPATEREARGARVSGSVVDDHDIPIAGAEILLVHTTNERDPNRRRQSVHRTVSDTGGRFEFDGRVAAGEWTVGVIGTGALIEPHNTRVRPATTDHALRIRVVHPDMAKAITGSVVDDTGRPLPDMRLVATGEGVIGRTRSKADGSFVLVQGGPWYDNGAAGVALAATDPDGALEQTGELSVTWGSRGVRVELRRRTSLTLEVVDARGRAVDDYDAVVYSATAGRRAGLMSYPGLELRRSAGRAVIAGLRNGPHAVLVRPKEATSGFSGVVRFDAPRASLVVRLPDPARIDLEVVDRAGKPLAGCRIEAIRATAGAAVTTRSAVTPLEALDPPRVPPLIRLATAKTGPTGQAELDLPPGMCTLRVTNPAYIPHLEPTDVPPGRTAKRIVLAPGASVTGTISPRAGDKSTIDSPRAAAPSEVDAGGRFRLSGLPPGRHTISLRYWLESNAVHAAFVTVPLAEVVLQPGEHRELALDGSAALPGSLSGIVRVDGLPLSDGHIFLIRRAGSGPRLSVRTRTNPKGEFGSALPPGSYHVTLSLPAKPGPGWNIVPLPGTHEVRAGHDTVTRIDARERRVVLRLLDKSGAPIAGQRVRIKQAGYFRPGALRTDSNGRVVITPAPYGAFRIDAGSHLDFSPIDVPAGQTTATIECRSR